MKGIFEFLENIHSLVELMSKINSNDKVYINKIKVNTVFLFFNKLLILAPCIPR